MKWAIKRYVLNLNWETLLTIFPHWLEFWALFIKLPRLPRSTYYLDLLPSNWLAIFVGHTSFVMCFPHASTFFEQLLLITTLHINIHSLPNSQDVGNNCWKRFNSCEDDIMGQYLGGCQIREGLVNICKFLSN